MDLPNLSEETGRSARKGVILDGEDALRLSLFGMAVTLLARANVIFYLSRTYARAKSHVCVL